MEFLLLHLETLKEIIPTKDKRIRECVLNSWTVMRKYYDLTDQSHSIYAAATLLNPFLRMAHFEKNWTGESVELLGSGRLRDDVLFYLLRGRPASFIYL
jgi:hypothetical protein